MKFCALVVVLVAVSYLHSAATQMEERSTVGSKNTVTIGGLFGVHNNEGGACGGITASPVMNVEAMIFAVDSINANTSLLPNVTLLYDLRDTCRLSNVALEETVELMDFRGEDRASMTRISGVIGAGRSDVSISLASLLRIFQLPQISYYSTATVLSNKQKFDYFLRTVPPDNFQAKAMADLIVHFNWTYVVGIHTDDTYGRGGINALIEELDNLQVCVITDPDITEISLDAEDAHYNKVVDFVDSKWVRNASIAVLFGSRKTARRLLRAIKNSNTPLDHLTWIASDSWAMQVPPEYQSIVPGMLGMLPRILAVEDFEKYYESLDPYNHTTNPWFREYWETVFECSLSDSNQTLEGVEPCNISSQSLGFEERGGGVPYVIDAVYAFAHAIENMISDHCSNGTGLCPEIMMKRFSQSVLNGTILRDYLLRVNFTSPTSDEVTFNEMGDQEDGHYEIVNLRSDGPYAIGTWDNENLLQITEAAIEWRGGLGVPESVCSEPCKGGEEPRLVKSQTDCCWTCHPCGDNMYSMGSGANCSRCDAGFFPNDGKNSCDPNPVVFLKWSDPWGVVISLCATLGLMASAFVIVVFIIFNQEKIIKATSRELSAILLTGITLCYILPFFFIAPPSPAICAIRRFGIGFCFSLCFSPLLMKTNRIYRVFHTAPQTPRFAGPHSQVVFSCLVISVQIVIGILWLGLERPSVRTIVGRRTTEKICGESPYIGLPVSLVYSLLVLMLATFYSFLARSIPEKFNEMKFIAVTLYTICIIWLGFFPTYFATIRLGIVYQTTSLVFAILLSATTTLACLFVPKVILLFIQLYKGKKDGQTTQNPTTTTTGDYTLRMNIPRGSIDYTD